MIMKSDTGAQPSLANLQEYSVPRLTQFGLVREITASGSGQNPEAGQNQERTRRI